MAINGVALRIAQWIRCADFLRKPAGYPVTPTLVEMEYVKHPLFALRFCLEYRIACDLINKERRDTPIPDYSAFVELAVALMGKSGDQG